MTYEQPELEQEILSSVEHFRPIVEGSEIQKAIAIQIEEIKDARTRQNLRIMLQCSIAYEERE